jgi:hypothetical protein
MIHRMCLTRSLCAAPEATAAAPSRPPFSAVNSVHPMPLRPPRAHAPNATMLPNVVPSLGIQSAIAAAAAKFTQSQQPPLLSASTAPPAGASGSAVGLGSGRDDTRMADKVLHAAQSFANLTDFEGHAVKGAASASGASGDGALGEAMYKRFQAFDSMFLQPVFGRDGGERTGELPDECGAEGAAADGRGQPPGP